MLKVVFDAGPLITACKFYADGKLIVDHLLPGCQIVIAPSVEDEVAVLGAPYPDGVAAAERIADGRIAVDPISSRRGSAHLAAYALGDGERDSIELCSQIEAEALVVDDYVAFIAASRAGLKTLMLPDFVVELAKRSLLTAQSAEKVLRAIRPRYRKGVVEHSLMQLQEVM